MVKLPDYNWGDIIALPAIANVAMHMRGYNNLC